MHEHYLWHIHNASVCTHTHAHIYNEFTEKSSQTMKAYIVHTVVYIAKLLLYSNAVHILFLVEENTHTHSSSDEEEKENKMDFP